MLVAFHLILKATLKPKAFTINIMRMMSYGVRMSDNPQELRSMKKLSLNQHVRLMNEMTECSAGLSLPVGKGCVLIKHGQICLFRVQFSLC